jgi:hypothetical protein
VPAATFHQNLVVVEPVISFVAHDADRFHVRQDLPDHRDRHHLDHPDPDRRGRRVQLQPDRRDLVQQNQIRDLLHRHRAEYHLAHLDWRLD